LIRRMIVESSGLTKSADLGGSSKYKIENNKYFGLKWRRVFNN